MVEREGQDVTLSDECLLLAKIGLVRPRQAGATGEMAAALLSLASGIVTEGEDPHGASEAAAGGA